MGSQPISYFYIDDVSITPMDDESYSDYIALHKNNFIQNNNKQEFSFDKVEVNQWYLFDNVLFVQLNSYLLITSL